MLLTVIPKEQKKLHVAGIASLITVHVNIRQGLEKIIGSGLKLKSLETILVAVRRLIINLQSPWFLFCVSSLCFALKNTRVKQLIILSENITDQ